MSTRTLILLAVASVSCKPTFRVAERAQISCSERRECPDGFDCADGFCVPDNGNLPPSIELDAPTVDRNVVVLPLRVYDDEHDAVTLTAQLITETGETLIELEVDPFEASSEGAAVAARWDASAFVTRYTGGLRVRITPRDEFRTGQALTTDPFAVGNDPPRVTDIVVGTGGVVSGVTQVAFTLVDQEPGQRITSFALINGETIIDVPLTNPPVLTATPAGVRHMMTWDTSDAAPLRAAGLRVRLTATDTLSAVSTPTDSAPFVIDNAPTVTLYDPMPPAGTRGFDRLDIPFDVADPNGDVVSVAFDYVLQGVWHPATGVTMNGVFHWDLLADLPKTVRAGETMSLAVVDLRNDVKLRARPTDARGTVGDDVIVAPGELGNEPPVVTIDPLESPQTGVVRVAIDIGDSSHDPADVRLEFCTGLGCSDWRRAAISGADSDLPTGGLTAADPARPYVLLWDSTAAANPDPTIAQGVGATVQSDVSIRVVAADRVDGTTRVWGTPSAPSVLASLENASPPRIVFVRASRGIVSTGNSPVPITYAVTDTDSDDFDLLCEHQRLGSNQWTRCLEARVPESEGFYDLESVNTDAGLVHTFVWDPASGPFDASIRIRLTVSDGTAPPRAPIVFELAEGIGWPGDLGYDEGGPENGTREIDPNLVYWCDWWSGGPTTGYMTVADFNGDGRQDLAVGAMPNSNLYDMQVWIARDIGDFGLNRATTSGPTYQSGLVGCDLDGDQNDDLVVGSEQSLNLAVYHSSGASAATGAFDAVTTPSTQSWKARTLAAGDFNEDGKCDIVVAGWGNPSGLDPRFGFMRGAATSPFLNPEGLAEYAGSMFGSSPYKVAVADMNQDGHDDVVGLVSGGGVNELVILYGTGSFSFSAKPRYILAIPSGAVTLELVDLTNDGLTDVAIAYGGSTNVIRVFPGKPGGGVDDINATDLPVPNSPIALAVGDVTSDSWPDLLVLSAGTEKVVSVFLNENRYNQLSFAPPFQLKPMTNAYCTANPFNSPNDIALIDIGMNGPESGGPPGSAIQDADVYTDGLLDIVVNDGAGARLFAWFEKDLSERLSRDDLRGTTTTDLSSDLGATDAMDLDRGDFDGDGALDLVTSSHDEIVWLRNLGDASVGARVLDLPLSTGLPAANTVVADLNDDGRDDLVIYGGIGPIGDDGVTIALNDGAGSFLTPTTYLSASVMTHALLADLTGDGVLDVVLLADGVDVILLAGTGDGVFDEAFATVHTQTLANPQDALAIADFDNDGDLDIAVTGGSFLSLIANDGIGGLATPSSTLNSGATAIAADVSGDGNVDLIYGGADLSAGISGEQLIQVWLGDGALGFTGGPFADGPAGHSITEMALGDFDGDGVLDLFASLRAGTSDTALHVFRATAPTGGLFTDALTVATESEFGDPQFHLAPLDVDGDGMLDIAHVAASTAHLSIVLATETRWRGNARRFNQADLRAVGAVAPTGNDRFGLRRRDDLLTIRPLRAPIDGQPDFRSALDRSSVTRPNAPLAALTAPWRVDGDVLFHRVQDGRLRVDPRLNLSMADGRYVIFELPAIDGITASTPAKVHLYRAAFDWLRNGQYLATGVVSPRLQWTEITLDPDNDLRTGTGERFSVKDARIRMAVERLGVFQAFVEP